MSNTATSLTKTELEEIAQALFAWDPVFYESLREAEEDIKDRPIFKVDHYVTDSPDYAGVLYVVVLGVPMAVVLTRRDEGRLQIDSFRPE